MTVHASVAPDLERLPSHIPGLDVILDGGFFSSGVYILLGTPGSGKTLLANQLCYGHVAAGGQAVYVTLLAESHSRMLQHLRPMSFFDESVIPAKLTYISAFHDLETDGLKGLLSVLHREMRARRASVMVLDGLVSATETAENDRALKKFIHEMQTSAIFHGCTIFLLTSSNANQRISPEHTMVDGLIELEDRLFDVRAERQLQIRKFRGAKPIRGKHAFQIGLDGIRVFPRVEALFDQPPHVQSETELVSCGLPDLDVLLSRQGFESDSATLVVGPAGSGKTTLALHFLSQCSAASPGMMFSFFESPERLCTKADALNINIAALQAQNVLHFLWHSQGEHVLDELAHHLLDAVANHHIKRLAIDGLAGFFAATLYPERLGRFLACLANELRRRGVTLLMTLEISEANPELNAIPYGLSAITDNLLRLTRSSKDEGIKRQLAVIKIRNDHFDSTIRTFDIAAGKGLRLLPLSADPCS